MDKSTVSTVWLDNSRIIAMFAVVCLHVATIVMVSNEVGSTYWWFGNIYNSLVRWCVPVFVMISGGLLLDPQKQENLSTFYRKRIAKLFMPLTVWSLLFLAWRFLKGLVKTDVPTATDLFRKLISGNPYEHLWFLYMILGLYLFTPFLRQIITKSTPQELNILIIAVFSLVSLDYTYKSFNASDSGLFTNWFLSYIPFFLLGYRIRNSQYRPSKTILWSTFLATCVLTAVGGYNLAIKNNLAVDPYFYGYLSLTVIPMSVSVMYLLRELNSPMVNHSFTKELSLLTLGIYLIHPIILEAMGYTGYATEMHALVSIPAITTLIFLITFGIAWSLNQVPYLKRLI